MEFKRDKNVGRVVSSGGDQMLVTGRKADGRYVVMGKDGRKTAKDAVDIGVIAKESVVGVDLDDLHESMKQARKNVGASTCWKGYKAKGTKKKDGKVVLTVLKKRIRLKRVRKVFGTTSMLNVSVVRNLLNQVTRTILRLSTSNLSNLKLNQNTTGEVTLKEICNGATYQ